MADRPFDQTNIGVRERPFSSDINGNVSQTFQTIREIARMMLSPRASNTSSAMSSRAGFIGDGFRVVPSNPAAMTVQVSAGLGFNFDASDEPTNINTISAPNDLERVNDLSPFKPWPLALPVTFTVPAAPASPNSRIDIIEVKTDRRLEDATTRKQLDSGSLSYLDHIFMKTLAYALDGRTGTVTSPANSTAGLSYKVGVAGNPGAVPATTTGYTKIAEILVPNGTTSIVGNNLIDRRKLFGMHGFVHGSLTWRQQFNAGTPIVTILSAVTPPGVDVGIQPLTSSGHNQGFVIVTGGDITRATMTINAQSTTTQQFNVMGGFDINGFGVTGPVVTTTSTEQARLNAAGINAGIGQKAVMQQFLAQMTNATSTTNAALDDLIWNMHFTVGYH